MHLLVLFLILTAFERGSCFRIFHHGRQRVHTLADDNALDGEDQWFTQVLDHFTPTDNRTWKQRYFSNDEYYKPGGPVFLMIGGEGPANAVWMHQGNWIELAKKYNASLFSLEHRFYGKSKPTVSLTLPNLQYLSTEQALADLAYFITAMKFDRKLAKNRWIVFGGSYPGNLAAWARLKYPHLIHGAVASSAPINAKLNFKDYLSSVSVSLGKQCTAAILVSTAKIEKLIESKDRKALRKDLMLCDDVNLEDKSDISNLFETLAGNFEGVVQYNKGNRDFEGARGTNITIDLVCGLLTSSPGQEYEKYKQIVQLILEVYNQSCLDFKYSKMLKEMKRTDWNASGAEGGRQWLYQTCTEFGYYQTSDDPNQPFGNNFGLDFSIQQCQDIFDKKFNIDFLRKAVKRTNMLYGALHIQASNIFFVNGAIDPWHILGFTRNQTKKVGGKITSVFIPETSHCADMYPPREGDPKSLQEARNLIDSVLGSWLKIRPGRVN